MRGDNKMIGITIKEIKEVLNELNSNTVITSFATYMDKNDTGIALFSSESEVKPVAKIPYRNIEVPNNKNK